MLALYGILASMVGLGVFPILRLRAAVGGKEWRERLALALPVQPAGAPPPLWCHAASAGEVESLLPIVEEIRRRHAEIPLVFSTTTVTGSELAQRRTEGMSVFLLPLDIPWLMARAIVRLRPRGIVLGETELWPALIRESSRRRIPLALVNGRVSPGGFRRYRLIRPLVREMLEPFRLLAMQSEEDRERIVRLGGRPQVIEVTGNAKADAVSARYTREERARAREEWGIPSGIPLLAAGSVRPEEVGPVLRAFNRARERFGTLRLLLAPRHMDRAVEAEREAGARGLTCRRRSAGGRASGSTSAVEWQVFLLDTMGELASAYALADMAFVGGTLDPRYGGHNPLEPASRGVPVLLGPHYRNCAVAAARLLEGGGALMVRGEEDLAREVIGWLDAPERRLAAGEAAARGAAGLRGVASRTVDLLERAVLEQ